MATHIGVAPSAQAAHPDGAADHHSSQSSTGLPPRGVAEGGLGSFRASGKSSSGSDLDDALPAQAIADRMATLNGSASIAAGDVVSTGGAASSSSKVVPRPRSIISLGELPRKCQ